MLRFLTAGESHGPALVVIVEGLPAGLIVTEEMLANELARRRLGFGRGPRMRFERDEIEILGGIRHGRTLGSPVAVEIRNTEWPRWEKEMSPAPGKTAEPLHRPRPGHADLAGMQKYGFTDARDVLERASARETAARVVAGALAKALIAPLGTEILSHVIQIGEVRVAGELVPAMADLPRIDASEVRCFDETASRAMVDAVKAAAKDGDSLGGIVEVLGYGVPVGLGSHVHWDRRIDGLLAGALMSIQAIKGVEVGDGFQVAGLRGTQSHDEILWDKSHGYMRETSRAGGVEGGMTTGALLVARAAMKPLATLNRPVLRTVNVQTKEQAVSFKERTDVMAVPAAGVVAEAMVALVLANEALRKFGGDSLSEFVGNHDAFIESLRLPGRAKNSNAPISVRIPRHLVLVGMPGSGKSTVGIVCAQRLGWRFVDIDRQVEAAAGMPITEIFATEGEEGFRLREREAIQEACASPLPAVIACGGGAVGDVASRRTMRAHGFVVWLKAPPLVLAQRVGDGRGRPLISGEDPTGVLVDLDARRGSFYAEVANIEIDATGSPGEVAAVALEAFEK